MKNYKHNNFFAKPKHPELIVNGTRYTIYNYYANVFRVLEINEAKTLTELEKIGAITQLLLGEKQTNDLWNRLEKFSKKMEREEYVRVFKAMFDELIDLATSYDFTRDTGKNYKKTMDFQQDADLIYASFMFDYGIDLKEPGLKITWQEFLMLLNNLSEDSPLVKVIEIRQASITKFKDTETRRKLIEQKQRYRLVGPTIKKGFDDLERIRNAFQNKIK